MTGGAGQADLLEYDVALRAVRRGQELVVFRRRARSYLARDPTVHPPAEEEDILFDESRWMAPAREGPADSRRSRGLLHHEIKRVCRVARGK